MKSLMILITTLFALTASAGFQGYQTTTDLGLFSKIKCSTGLTCTRVGDKMNIVSSPTLVAPLTLESLETISNATDDTVKIASEDNNTTLQVYGFEAKSAILQLWADEGDDAADKYSLTADVSDVLTMANAGGAVDFKLNAFEATDAKITLQADESDDSGDDWEIKSAASGNALTFSNDASGSQVAKLTISASAGNVSGPGTGTMAGFLRPVVAATATTITAAQCGSTFINSGAVQMELPEASTVIGCVLTFSTANASNFDINPDNADQILVQTNAVGDATRNATLGNSITLQAINASQWVPISVQGTWSDIN